MHRFSLAPIRLDIGPAERSSVAAGWTYFILRYIAETSQSKFRFSLVLQSLEGAEYGSGELSTDWSHSK